MGKVTWEYLAGFTDGEGYIGVVANRQIRFTWGQRDEGMLSASRDFLVAEGFHPSWGCIAAKLPRRPNDIFMLHLNKRDEALRLVDILEPLLIFKAPNCAVVREWHEANPSRGNRSHIKAEVVRRMVAEGFSGSGIGAALKCSRQRVYKIARKAGIAMQPSGGRSENGRRLPRSAPNV
jgi:hypothetical protein